MDLTCLDKCITDDNPLSYEPITAGEYLDERSSDMSDYSAILFNIPPTFEDQAKNLRLMVDKFCQNRDGSLLRVHDVVLLPPTKQLKHLEEEKDEQIHAYLHAYNENHKEEM